MIVGTLMGVFRTHHSKGWLSHLRCELGDEPLNLRESVHKEAMEVLILSRFCGFSKVKEYRQIPWMKRHLPCRLPVESDEMTASTGQLPPIHPVLNLPSPLQEAVLCRDQNDVVAVPGTADGKGVALNTVVALQPHVL